MPSKLNLALSDRVLTSAETQDILTSATATEVEAMLEELAAAVHSEPADALQLDTDTKQKVVNDFLSGLDQVQRLSLDRTQTKPDGTIDWISAMRLQRGDGLAQASFGGAAINISPQGTISVGGQAVTAPDTQAGVDALLGLARPGQLTTLSTQQRKALLSTLLTNIANTLPAPADQPNKFKRITAGTASLYALGTIARSATPAQVDTLVATFAKAQNPLTQALVLRALDQAKLSPTQQTAREALSVPNGEVLIAAYATAAAKTGLAAQLSMIGAIFSRDGNAVANFARAGDVYGTYEEPGTATNDVEAQAFATDLETYINGSPQSSFVFGAFVQDAPKHLAKLTNARVAAALAAELNATPPSFRGAAVTAEQATALGKYLPGIANEASAEAFKDIMQSAHGIFGTTAPAALPPAAFAYFARAADQAFAQRTDSHDAMIDTEGLTEQVAESIASLRAALAPRWETLSATPASFEGITLSANAAQAVKTTLSNHLRSEMSISNLAGALEVLAGASKKLDDTGAQKLTELVSFYRSNWPSSTVFDFNKLPRIATFFALGQSVPLCTINGQAIALGEFYAQVGRKVAASINPSSLTYPWMSERWGQRAMQSVELLDVIAQQTAEGAGPITELQKAYPNRAVTVHVQGQAGAHEQFIFEVAGVGSFNQGSDGKIERYRAQLNNKLFSAVVGKNGTFDVKTTANASMNGWPMQTTYAVGDTIDMRYMDRDAANAYEEGKKFSTRHKILPATIESYDASGHYTVAYKKPDGELVRASVTLANIEQDNDPHDFDLNGSEFSDSFIDVNTQPELAKFLDGARPIIDKFLPRDGSIFTRSAAEQASAQRDCVAALQAYMRPLMTYPADKGPNADEASNKYHEMVDGLGGWETAPLGDYLKLKRGVCRHQCIIAQLVLQIAGIDSRLASGAANTDSGDFRGFHIWNELSLADNARYLSDQTWNDAIIPLWNGAYDSDLRRIELYDRTARYDVNMV